MRRMSFMLTVRPMIEQRKTVTRRNGWNFLKVGDLIQPVYKCQGLKRGQKQIMLGYPIKITAISKEPLEKITKAECRAEGFARYIPETFIKMYCKANTCERTHIVTRIEFEYTRPK